MSTKQKKPTTVNEKESIMKRIAWLILSLLVGQSASARAESSYRQFCDWSNNNPSWVPVASHIALGAGIAYALRTQGASPVVSWIVPSMIGIGKEELLDKNASMADMSEWAIGGAVGAWLGGVRVAPKQGGVSAELSTTF